MQSLITTLLILAVLVLIWHVRELWGEVDLLKTMERKTQESQANYRKEFNDFLDNAKGSSVLDKFMRKGLEGNDKAQANLLDAFTLTNEAQRMFLKDLLPWKY